MKVLAVANRLKWMRTCAALWRETKQNFSQILFAADDVKEGERLNDLLETIPAEIIEGFMTRVERKTDPGSLAGSLERMGLSFDFSGEKSTLTVNKMA